MKKRMAKKNSNLSKREFIIKEIKEYIIAILLAVIVYLVINQFVQLGFISGDSMLETYRDNQPVVIFKRDKNHEVGEVVTFEYTQEIDGQSEEITGRAKADVIGNQHVKRILGVAGDRVVIKNNTLYINDELISESKLTIPDQDYVVEENHVFVGGDNVNVSYDSRFHGPIPIDALSGVVITGDDNPKYN